MAPLRIDADRANPSEVLERLKEGTRVVIDLDNIREVTREVTLRRSGSTYYCDNGVRLTTYRTIEGMRQCLENLGLLDSTEQEAAAD